MKNQLQVCTMWQAMELQNIGIAQKSLWYWQKMKEPVVEGCATERLEFYANVGNLISDSVVSSIWAAFTSAELSILLPDNLPCIKKEDNFEISANKKDYAFPQIEEGCTWFVVRSNLSEAEAKAQMLILLLKNNLITSESCSSRLIEEKDLSL